MNEGRLVYGLYRKFFGVLRANEKLELLSQYDSLEKANKAKESKEARQDAFFKEWTFPGSFDYYVKPLSVL